MDVDIIEDSWIQTKQELKPVSLLTGKSLLAKQNTNNTDNDSSSQTQKDKIKSVLVAEMADLLQDPLDVEDSNLLKIKKKSKKKSYVQNIENDKKISHKLVIKMEEFSDSSSDYEISLKCLKNRAKSKHSCKKKPIFNCKKCSFTCYSRLDLKEHKLKHFKEKSLCCNLCDFRTTQLNKLLIHERIHTGERPFKCEDCDSSFGRKCHLKRHMETHQDKGFKCEICGFVCRVPSTLKKHTMAYHTDNKPLSCSKCDIECSKWNDWTIHKKKHRKEHCFHCEQCEGTFKTISHLKRHMLIHARKEILTCKFFHICGFVCTNKKELKEHNKTHAEDRFYACYECGLTFKQACYLKRHRLTHSGFKPYACDECSFTCRDSTRLLYHKEIHDGENPFVCNSCSFNCNSLSRLKEHQEIHTQAMCYECDQCDYACRQATRLKKHMETHKESHTCSKCTFVTTCITEFTKHKKSHMSHTLFDCDECDKKFTRHSLLKLHQISHLKKSFTCDVCSFTCEKLSNLKKHKEGHDGAAVVVL